MEIVQELLNNLQSEVFDKITAKVPAVKISNDILKRYITEMNDSHNSVLQYNLIIFSYQGVRMCRKFTKIDTQTQERIMRQIQLYCYYNLRRYSYKNIIILVRPFIELKQQALNYKKEHFLCGEKEIRGSELFDHTESYEEWLVTITKNTKEETVNKEWVLTDTFFAIRESDKKC